jgi:hypothetical protein
VLFAVSLALVAQEFPAVASLRWCK